MKIMNAIILAAGLGIRLNPLIKDIPKCLIEVNRIPIIERCISIIRKYDIEQIIVVLGFQSGKIREFIGHKFGLSGFLFIENPEYQSSNNIVSLWLAREHLKQGAFIIESDIVFEEKAFQILAGSENKSFWMVDRFVKGMDGCLLETNDAGEIISIRIVREDLNEYTDKMFKSVGILKLNSNEGELLSAFLDQEVKADNKKIYYDLVFAKYLSSLTVFICNIEGYKWAEVDNYQDLLHAQQMFINTDG
jgi:choline kinase